MEEKTPDFALLRAKIQQKKQIFERFYALLVEYNAKFNLTAITEKEEVFHKHFLDCVAGEGLLPPSSNVVEIGSGAGFPSIPLKIIRDDLKMTLVESTGKKCVFLTTVVEALELKNVEVVNARAEELGKKEEYRERYDCVIARAVAPLSSLAEYCMPLIRKGGSFIAWKGSVDEVENARHALTLLGGGKTQSIGYELPSGYGARTLVVTKKQQNTPEKYPRGRGQERKNPL